jgi:hypothetical protein
MSAPKTAPEFRERVSAFIIPNMESFDVDRPFRDVAETFRTRAPECLDKTIQRSMRYGTMFDHWNPTVIVTEGKAELYVRYFKESKVMRMHDNSEKGEFAIVVDIVPAAAGKTGVTLYKSSISGVSAIVEAVRHWAGGTHTRCPDL